MWAGGRASRDVLKEDVCPVGWFGKGLIRGMSWASPCSQLELVTNSASLILYGETLGWGGPSVLFPFCDLLFFSMDHELDGPGRREPHHPHPKSEASGLLHAIAAVCMSVCLLSLFVWWVYITVEATLRGLVHWHFRARVLGQYQGMRSSFLPSPEGPGPLCSSAMGVRGRDGVCSLLSVESLSVTHPRTDGPAGPMAWEVPAWQTWTRWDLASSLFGYYGHRNSRHARLWRVSSLPFNPG